MATGTWGYDLNGGKVVRTIEDGEVFYYDAFGKFYISDPGTETPHCL